MKNFNLKKDFGKNVFGDINMKKYLPKEVYQKLKKTIKEGVELDTSLAEVVANGMMNWAVDNGATHFTHWFQPLNDSIAEKHESFLRLTDDKKPILEFSGKELIKGETDASSFPTGNIRATFEARGYTIWDCTSPAFLRIDKEIVTLCIPTAFISYGGEALDNKTPLLRSMQVISNESIKLLKLFNKKAKKVTPMIGIEQEYFLISKARYLSRKDLIYTGRTIFGAKTPKGQELDDHYSGMISSQVLKIMNQVNRELWLLGVPAKIQHNEVAPCQHELAVIYEEANVSCDHNQLVMETLKRVASEYDMICLLHEKPFKYVNGSGKHDNWSLITDDGENLLNPGNKPHENLLFLLVLSCVLAGVDEHQLLLRASCATPGKEQRLGASEAPPAIISCFIGDQLNDIVESFIAQGFAKNSKEGGKIKKDINILPELWLDATDRNRTSPFAFTGNKFEFRMVGSNDSCAMPTTVINTIVAAEFSKATEALANSKNFNEDLKQYIRDNFAKHKKILFSGDGYSKEWEIEAKKRGLKYAKTIIDAIPAYIDDKTVELFEKFSVLTKNELKCRYEVALENYINITNIEAMTAIRLAKKYILPACIDYTTKLSKSINEINEVCKNKNYKEELDTTVQEEMLKEISLLIRKMKTGIDKIEKYMIDVIDIKDVFEKASFYKFKIGDSIEALRDVVDRLEMIVDKQEWPIPSVGDVLFGNEV